MPEAAKEPYKSIDPLKESFKNAVEPSFRVVSVIPIDVTESVFYNKTKNIYMGIGTYCA